MRSRYRLAKQPDGVFYGWVIVAAASLVLFVAYGIQFSYGVFVKAMGEEMGWTRAQTALPYAVYVFLYSALSATSGRMTDRFGPRRVVGTGAVLLLVGWGLSSRARQPWHLLVTMGFVAACGMSSTWAPCSGTVVRWFTRLRGTAVSITTSGGSVGNLVVPLIAALLVGTVGWRSTMLGMAVGGGVLIFLAAQLLYRDPESRGLHPDGDAVATQTPISSLSLGDVQWTAPFLLIIGAYALTWLTVFVPFVHAPAFAEELGASDISAATVLSATGVGGILGRLASGGISDRVGRFPTLLTMFGLTASAFFLFASAEGIGPIDGGLAMMWPAAVLFGWAYGGSTALFPALVGDIFGTTHAGTIIGAVFARAGSTAALGPYVAGWLYDSTGAYGTAFLLCGGLNVLGLGFVVALALNQRRSVSTETT
ncbi:MAG: MFS transporter [Actinomycetota bacterium]|nr:MFS transporter [Actinomycetota bacterium]